jgi:hypothetical protein
MSPVPSRGPSLRWVPAPSLMGALVVCALLACREETVAAKKAEPDAAQATKVGATASTDEAEVPERAAQEPKRRPRSIVLAHARELIGWRVADGFLTRAELLDAAFEAADRRESLRPTLDTMVDEELRAHRQREAEWKYLTEPDRLTRAFVALEKAGVIARERFADCRKCGQADMKDVREELLEQGHRAEGYVFSTDQQVDGVSQSGELWLEYGAFRDDAQAHRRVAEKVLEALRGVGLSVTEGELDADEPEERGLLLSELTWQRRRFTRAPAR